MQEKTPTKKQHFVPQVYLRGFSQDKKRVYSFDLKTGIYKQTPIPIESVCYEKYLYEIKDVNGNPVIINLIEKILCDLEGDFANYRNRLKKKAFNKGNYNTKCFLAKEEKIFWILFITVQILRSPLVLDKAEQFIKEHFSEASNENIARTWALNQCLPFLNKVKAEDKILFNMVLKPFAGMMIAVGVDENGSLFTSDYPVYCCAPNYKEGVYETVYFPICRSLVLILFGGTGKEQCYKNRLIKLEQELIVDIKKSIAHSARTWLFSANPFSSDDIKLINEARKDKQNDNAHRKSDNFGGSNEQL